MKVPIGLKLDPELVARIDKVRDGSRTRFIEEAVLEQLAQREGTAVEKPAGNNPQSSVPAPVFPTTKRIPSDREQRASLSAARLAHRPQCTCAVCKPPKAAA